MGYIIGIDGGATKTRGLLARSDGRIIDRLTVGPTNYRTRGIEEASHLLSNLVSSLLDDTNLQLDDLEIIVGGMAGVHEDFDKKRIEEGLRKALPTEGGVKIEITNDLYIALVGGLQQEFGVVTNAGTGAISIGANKSGRRFLSDGWGYLLGDSGSGFWIGLEAMKATLKSADNRGRDTALEEMIVTHYSLEKTPELLNIAYSDNGSAEIDKIAGLSPLVFTAAQEGDEIALEIIVRAGEELAKTTCAVVDALELTEKEFPLVLSGGVFDANFKGPLVDKFVAILDERCPGFQLTDPDFPPEVGSLLIGLRRIHGELVEGLLANVGESWEKMDVQDD